MKKIFLVLFLIIAVSIPALAKKQQMEEDWIKFMTSGNDSDWYYDLNSIKSFGDKRVFGRTITFQVKEISQNGKEQKYLYTLDCDGVVYANGKVIDEPHYFVRDYNYAKQRYARGYGKQYNVQQGYVSGNLYNEFCITK